MFCASSNPVAEAVLVQWHAGYFSSNELGEIDVQRAMTSPNGDSPTADSPNGDSPEFIAILTCPSGAKMSLRVLPAIVQLPDEWILDWLEVQSIPSSLPDCGDHGEGGDQDGILHFVRAL